MAGAGIRYIDVCSGISAPTMAWKPLGWKALCFAEIEAFPRAVLAHHYPDVPLNGDFTQIKGNEYGPVDLLVGGTPCQPFSVAGLRGGMADGRGNLALEYIRLAHRARARWVVWENVPGVFSSNKGEDFRCFLSGLVRWNVPLPEGGWSNAGVIAAGPADGAYGVVWRVLDAQFAGVPQRRRRVFVVGYLGDWRRAAAVLFERHSLSGDTPPRREARSQLTQSLTTRFGNSGADLPDAEANWLVPGVSPTLRAGGNRTGGDRPPGTDVDTADSLIVAHSLRAEGFDASEDGTGRGTPLVVGFAQNQRDELRTMDVAGALAAEPGMKQQTYIAFSAKDHGADAQDNLSPTLRAGGHSGSHANAGVMPAVAFTGSREVAGALTSNYGKQPDSSDTNLGPTLAVGTDHASPQEAYTTSLLRSLREQVGEEAFTQWGLGVLHSLQSPEVLRSQVHGGSVRCEADEAGRGLDDGTLPREARRSDGAVCGLWQAGSERRPPQGRELPQQLADELGSALSQLSHEAASTEAFVCGLRRAGQGLGLLQQALPSAQGRPTSAVRRLTPEECEKLQGFPPGFTQVPYRNKPAADGPRYKALGNSMAVPVVRWIGERIEAVEAMAQAERAAA